MAQLKEEIESVKFPSRSEESVPGAQPPLESTAPDVRPVPKVAGGGTSALAAARFAFREMGIIRGARSTVGCTLSGGADGGGTDNAAGH